jgi:ribose 5-phosphate isomerase A
MIDVTVDGADEVADDLSISKGAGGALTREKIVAHASKRLVIVCDASKRVPLLGMTRPISIEVLRFGHATTLSTLAAHGKATLRQHGGGLAVTDAGNYLVDLVPPVPLTAPGVLDRELRSIPGVVETGLFLGRAALVLVARDDGKVERLER